MSLSGVFTALITPFVELELDEKGLAANIERQIEGGVSGLVALGTTGEAPTLTDREFDRVVSIAVQQTRGRIPVVVGTGDCATARAIQKTARAQELGADLALIVMPWFNKPTQEGLYRHVSAIADAVSIPLLIYNMPSRTGVNLFPETTLRMAGLSLVVGMKEEIHQAAEVMSLTRCLEKTFSLFSGDDSSALPIMALGGCGVISVVSNLIPEDVVALTNAVKDGRLQEAQELHYRMHPLIQAAFIETNPMPIKYAMEVCGLPAGESRAPLGSLRPESRAKMLQVLEQLSILKRVTTG